MTCHSWMGPVGVMEGACDTGTGEENTEEERGRGGARGWTGGAAEIKRLLLYWKMLPAGHSD